MNKIFNRNTLITTWIPTIVIILPANLIAQHYFGGWGVALIIFGFLAFGALMLWDSYYRLQQSTKRLRESFSQFSDEEIDTAVNNFEQYTDADTAQVIRAELATFRKQAGRQ